MLTNAHINAIVPAADLTRARKFYEDKLGLKVIAEDPSPGVTYQGREGSLLYLYQTPFAGKAGHTIAGFSVENVEATVAGLKAKGVAFEEYDMPNLKTVNSILTMGPMKAAWFKDTEGNILAVGNLKTAVKEMAVKG